MLFHFINVLLQVLLHKSHDLLQEEMTVAIYNMASVDFDAFYSAFMPEFLGGCQGVDAGQRAVLARNFKLERVKMRPPRPSLPSGALKARLISIPVAALPFVFSQNKSNVSETSTKSTRFTQIVSFCSLTFVSCLEWSWYFNYRSYITRHFHFRYFVRCLGFAQSWGWWKLD